MTYFHRMWLLCFLYSTIHLEDTSSVTDRVSSSVLGPIFRHPHPAPPFTPLYPEPAGSFQDVLDISSSLPSGIQTFERLAAGQRTLNSSKAACLVAVDIETVSGRSSVGDEVREPQLSLSVSQAPPVLCCGQKCRTFGWG